MKAVIGVAVLGALVGCGGGPDQPDPGGPKRFAQQVAYPSGAGDTNPVAIAIGDLTGDGAPDLVVQNNHTATLAVLANRGDGTFADAVEYPGGDVSLAIADVDADGRLDVVDTFVRLNRGAGALPDQTALEAGIYAVAIGPLDAGGVADLAETGPNNTVTIQLGAGAGAFAAGERYPAHATLGSAVIALAIADLDRDGDGDLVTGDFGDIVNGRFFGTHVGVLVNRGDGTFAAPAAYPTVKAPTGIAVADLDRDGSLDVVVASRNDLAFAVLRGRGDGTLAAPVMYPTSSNFTLAVAAGDLDGDGAPDVALPIGDGNELAVFYNLGDGTFAEQETYRAGLEPHAIAIADLDGDGRLDLAVANRVSSTIGVFLQRP